MTITNFEQVSVRASKSLPCPSCGRRVRRSRTFTNTINPWNTNTLGEPKSRAEVSEDVRAEANEWAKIAEWHVGCAS